MGFLSWSLTSYRKAVVEDSSSLKPSDTTILVFFLPIMSTLYFFHSCAVLEGLLLNLYVTFIFHQHNKGLNGYLPTVFLSYSSMGWDYSARRNCQAQILKLIANLKLSNNIKSNVLQNICKITKNETNQNSETDADTLNKVIILFPMLLFQTYYYVGVPETTFYTNWRGTLKSTSWRTSSKWLRILRRSSPSPWTS